MYFFNVGGCWLVWIILWADKELKSQELAPDFFGKEGCWTRWPHLQKQSEMVGKKAHIKPSEALVILQMSRQG